ncbi:MAG: hypothetical protein P1U63_07735 [Coxiellaceae bacterium]|nr:hypothetical protein [Coxiellaceae bacterium]
MSRAAEIKLQLEQAITVLQESQVALKACNDGLPSDEIYQKWQLILSGQEALMQHFLVYFPVGGGKVGLDLAVIAAALKVAASSVASMMLERVGNVKGLEAKLADIEASGVRFFGGRSNARSRSDALGGAEEFGADLVAAEADKERAPSPG